MPQGATSPYTVANIGTLSICQVGIVVHLSECRLFNYGISVAATAFWVCPDSYALTSHNQCATWTQLYDYVLTLDDEVANYHLLTDLHSC